MNSQTRDDGAGVAYQVQYCIRPDPASETRLWVEDTGRWFAGPDGRPVRAHGVVRVINERYEREQRLAYLSRFDGLTGEMNRHHLTEVLEDTLEEATRFRSSCGFLLVAIDNLARINEVLRLRRRRRGDRRGRQAHAQPHARQGHARPLFRQQVRHRAAATARPTTWRSRPSGCSPACATSGADRGRAGRGHRDDRRRHRAAPRPQRAGNPRARPGSARHRQGQAPRLVPGLSAEYRARGAAPRERARDRRDRRRAQRAPHLPRLRAGGRDDRRGGPPSTNA